MKVTPAQWEEARAWLDGGATLQEVADRLGVSRERVRQKCGPRSKARSDRQATARGVKLAAAAEAVRGGASISAAAEQVRMNRDELRRALRAHGVVLPPPQPLREHNAKRRAEADERAAVVARLYRSGMPIADIASGLGIRNSVHVYNYLRRAGVAPDRNPQSGR